MNHTRKRKGVRSRTRKQRGGTRYENRPATISNRVFMANNDEEQYYYDVECVHTKVSEAVGNERKRAAMAAAAEEEAAASRRRAAVASDPTVEINESEYRTLPRSEQNKWKVSRREGPQWNTTTYYTRLRPENSIEWKAEHDPTVQLEEYQFRTLPPRIKALFKSIRLQTGMQEYTTYYVRKAAVNEDRALRATPEWQAEHDPHVQLTNAQFRTLPPRLQALLKPERIQTGIQEWDTFYVRAKPKGRWW